MYSINVGDSRAILVKIRNENGKFRFKKINIFNRYNFGAIDLRLKTRFTFGI